MTITLYTPEEASELLPLKPLTLIRYAKAKKIGCVRMGNKVRFLPEHIEAYIVDSTVPAQAEDPKPSRNPRYAGR